MYLVTTNVVQFIETNERTCHCKTKS